MEFIRTMNLNMLKSEINLLPLYITTIAVLAISLLREEILQDISLLRVNYLPDSALHNFVLYARDLYGFPWIFSSKDSAWKKR